MDRLKDYYLDAQNSSKTRICSRTNNLYLTRWYLVNDQIVDDVAEQVTK